MSVYFPKSNLLPATVEQLSLFIAYCYHNQMACSTVTSFISVISYLHKLAGLEDLSHSFVVKKSLQGLRKLQGKPDTRLPITYSILKILIGSLRHTCQSYFLHILFKAMYLLAFHGFLRIGEITHTKSGAQNNINYHEIKFLFSENETGVPYAFELHMTNFKHNITKSCHILLIKESLQQDMCPVKALWAYCRIRGTKAGVLFCFMDGTPISRQFFNKQLQLSFQWCNMDTNNYKGHSFRIGSASYAFEQGYSDERIQMMGRWRSCAYKSYIRSPMLQF